MAQSNRLNGRQKLLAGLVGLAAIAAAGLFTTHTLRQSYVTEMRSRQAGDFGEQPCPPSASGYSVAKAEPCPTQTRYYASDEPISWTRHPADAARAWIWPEVGSVQARNLPTTPRPEGGPVQLH